MLTVKQIATIIATEMNLHASQDMPEGIANAAEKIHDLVKPDHTIHIATAALEQEVTSTLLNMLAASILATLIEEEGGGRTNIQFSPLGMVDILERWDFTVEIADMVRTVRITAKTDDEWAITGEPAGASTRLGELISTEVVSLEGVKPQAEPHEYNRPVWVVACNGPTGNLVFYRQLDRAGAERELRSWEGNAALESNAHIENRWCLHPECPSTGCNHDVSLRDTEVASVPLQDSTD